MKLRKSRERYPFRSKAASTYVILLTFGLSACGVSSSRVDYVETDTYLSSIDQANHSELTYLKVSNLSGTEERTLIKMPTGNRDSDMNLSNILKDPSGIVLFPFLIVAEIFGEIFNCQGKTLAPALLINAKLVFDVTGNDSGASLTNQLSLMSVSKPWWQNANWRQAHAFSSAGLWAQSGGDFDPTFTTLAANHVGSPSGTIEFDITNYFRNILQTQAPHYGMMLRSTGTSLPSVTLAASQFANQSQRPRVVSTYNCITPTNTLQGVENREPKPYTYILGPRY